MTAPDVPVNKAARFAHIDAMRAFAVMLVVVAHAGLGHIVPGGSGVTIFFSISGFVITYQLLRERERTGSFSAFAFYRRRAFKIFPPFFLIVVIPTLIYAVFLPVDWVSFGSQILFLFNWVYLSDTSGVLPGSGVVWSLAIEEQFYILFALIWLCTVRSARWKEITVAIAVVAIVLPTLARFALAFDPDMSRRIYYGSDTRLDGIAWGVLLAVWYHAVATSLKQRQLARLLASDWALVTAVLIYLLSLVIRDDYFRDTVRYSMQSIAACAVIAYGLLPGKGIIRRPFYAFSRWRPIELLGLASYSIYLAHLILAGLLEPYLLDVSPFVSVPVIAAIGVGGGLLVWWAVEEPARRYRQRHDRTSVSVHR